jgi:hypothetical protein
VYLIMTKPSANCQPRMFCVLIGSSSMLVDAATSAAVPSKTSSPPELPNSWKSGASSRSSRAVFMPLRSAGQRQTVRASIPSRYAPISGHVVRAWASSARSQLTVRAVSAGGQPHPGTAIRLSPPRCGGGRADRYAVGYSAGVSSCWHPWRYGRRQRLTGLLSGRCSARSGQPARR